LTEAMKQLGPCQVRSNTESPCLHRAMVVILGVGFCAPCARQQEAYFTIGEIMHEEEQGLRSEPLAAVLKMMRRERAGVKETMAVELHHGLVCAPDPVPIALANS
jgi:hypothetical protein